MGIVASGYNITNGEKKSPCMVTAFTYGGPRVGNDGYSHFGNELKINTSNSPYLKWRWVGSSSHVSPEFVPSSDEINMEEEMVIKGGLGEYVSSHSMDVYLHGIAGVQEEGTEFCLQVDHDIALVNKHLDRLKDCYGIPTDWWEGSIEEYVSDSLGSAIDEDPYNISDGSDPLAAGNRDGNPSFTWAPTYGLHSLALNGLTNLTSSPVGSGF
ncbi:phospholipase A1-II 1-like [Hibiscus syriacus]|uniref:phospholipase A1-II 1-like n=1 Tax=Hibiscus syriacus TaxID=106335 RepID=UPI0019216AE4|nr:phospholipase A1-II 1-like [Hibiscus syriacus]